MGLASDVSLMATLWAIEPMFMTCNVPPVATVTSPGSILNSLRWTMALVGTAASVAVPPDAVAGFDWSTARIASPTPTTAARSAPAATVKMTKSQPSLVLVGGGGGAGGPAWPPGRGFGAGSSPSVGATLGS